MVGPDWFAQVLEGPSVAVSSLFKRILLDTRHSHVQLTETRLIRDRDFGGWKMGLSHGPMMNMPLAAIIGHRNAQDPLDFPFDRVLRQARQQAANTSGA